MELCCSLMGMTERLVFSLLHILYTKLVNRDVVSQYSAFRGKARLNSPRYSAPHPHGMLLVTRYPALLRTPTRATAREATLTWSEVIHIKNNTPKGLFSAIRFTLCSHKQLLWHSWRGGAAAEDQDHAAGGGKGQLMPTSCGPALAVPNAGWILLPLTPWQLWVWSCSCWKQ